MGTVLSPLGLVSTASNLLTVLRDTQSAVETFSIDESALAQLQGGLDRFERGITDESLLEGARSTVETLSPILSGLGHIKEELGRLETAITGMDQTTANETEVQARHRDLTRLSQLKG